MADIMKLAPIILKWEAGAPEYRSGRPLTLDEQWAEARKKGFSNDPDDTGGATMCGVTIAAYRKYRRLKGRPDPAAGDLKAITLEEWLDILRAFYWDRMKADLIDNQSIANLCVDNVLGSGAGYIKQIQLAAGASPDGIVGPRTLAAINGHNQRLLFDKLWRKRKLFYHNLVIARPSNRKFLNGWLNRLNDFRFEEGGAR